MDNSIFKKRIIKVSTLNLLNLASAGKKYYNRTYNQTEYDKKVKWLSGQLNDIDADIIGFQEIFHREAIEEVLEKSGVYRDADFVMENSEGNRPVVGCVSRFPIEKYDIFNAFPEESILNIDLGGDKQNIELPFKHFSRPVLRAKIRLRENIVLNFYVAHLKSKRPMFFDDEDSNNPVIYAKGKARSLMLRAAESTALRALLMKDLHKREKPVIVVGDVNDSGHAVTTKLISGEAPHRRLPKDVKFKIWDTLLYHVKDIQARQSYQDFYYTHIHNGHYESLDHIMVSEEFVGENPHRIGRVGYVSLRNDHLIDSTLTNEKMPLWRTDHGIVTATIEMR